MEAHRFNLCGISLPIGSPSNAINHAFSDGCIIATFAFILLPLLTQQTRLTFTMVKWEKLVTLKNPFTTVNFGKKRSKIHPNGLELALEENQNPTVLEQLGRLDGFSIGRYEKNRESFDLYGAKFKSGAMQFGGKNRPGAGTLSKQGFFPCPSIIKNSQRRSQIHSK